MATDSGQFQSSQGGERPMLSPEEEIKELERRLEEKKREMAAGSAAPAEKAVEEKEVLREVLRERMEEVKPSARPQEPGLIPQLSVTPPPTDTAKKKTDDDKKSAAREEELHALAEYAMTHSISAAVEKASAESPYLLDALHDRLTDEYYDKMIALRKLKQV